jgi:protein SCO1/2
MRIILILILTLTARFACAQRLPDDVLKKISFDQKLGATISMDSRFRDEQGRPVRIGDYFGKRPVILVLGYYGCPMLCTLVLNGMISGLQDVKLEMGRDYDVVNVSIDPRETPALATAKKASYVHRFGQPDAAAGWHFLTGDEPSIRQLASEVGFNYAYDSNSLQFAHPSGLVILTPAGKISHYLSGVVFSSSDLRVALTDAAGAKVGSPIEQLYLLCFHYSPLTGRYSKLILTGVRAVSLCVLFVLVGYVATARWRVKSARN